MCVLHTIYFFIFLFYSFYLIHFILIIILNYYNEIFYIVLKNKNFMTTYSHSRLNTFDQCKYKYKLQYIDRIKVEIPTTIEAKYNPKIIVFIVNHINHSSVFILNYDSNENYEDYD